MLTKHIYAQEKLPYSIINKMVTQTDMFILNHSTQFAHVDLPKGKHQQFFGYIKDSAVLAIPNAQNPIYYKWYLKDGSEINGDLFYRDNNAYMLFKIRWQNLSQLFSARRIATTQKYF
jgi:hypothetical protein